MRPDDNQGYTKQTISANGESMDNTESKKCPICNGTGFSKPGQICRCISGGNWTDDDKRVIDFFREMFGMEPGKSGDK